jgi:hypothetical protein
LDRGLADGLGKMAFPAAGWTEKQGIFMAGDESARGQVEDQAAIHLLVEVEVEVVERLLRITKLRLLTSPLQQTLTSFGQLVGDRAGEQIFREAGTTL